MTYYTDGNLAIDIYDLDNKNSILSQEEQDFDKLLQEYINGIKNYVVNNDK